MTLLKLSTRDRVCEVHVLPTLNCCCCCCCCCCWWWWWCLSNSRVSSSWKIAWRTYAQPGADVCVPAAGPRPWQDAHCVVPCSSRCTSKLLYRCRWRLCHMSVHVTVRLGVSTAAACWLSATHAMNAQRLHVVVVVVVVVSLYIGKFTTDLSTQLAVHQLNSESLLPFAGLRVPALVGTSYCKRTLSEWLRQADDILVTSTYLMQPCFITNIINNNFTKTMLFLDHTKLQQTDTAVVF